MTRKISALLMLTLWAVIWVAAQPPAAPRTRPVRVVAPVLELPGKVVEENYLTILGALEANDYSNFIRAFDDEFKGVWTKAVFERFSQALARPLEQGYDVHYMGTVRKGLHLTFVWKLVFAGKNEERLTTISFKIVPPGEPLGKVSGFYVD